MRRQADYDKTGIEKYCKDMTNLTFARNMVCGSPLHKCVENCDGYDCVSETEYETSKVMDITQKMFGKMKHTSRFYYGE